MADHVWAILQKPGPEYKFYQSYNMGENLLDVWYNSFLFEYLQEAYISDEKIPYKITISQWSQPVASFFE